MGGDAVEAHLSATERVATIDQYLPLVRHIVFQVAVHFPRHVDREELATAGTLGLVEAAQRYDETRGVPFQRFAAQRIRGAILDAVRSADWAPRSVRTMARTLESTSTRLMSDLGRPPTIEEVASAMSTTPELLARLQDRIHRSVVLALDHRVVDADEESTLGELITDLAHPEPSVELEERELLGYLRDAVGLLPERHRLVVIGYFLEGRTSGELARFLGVTESRVSQLRSEGLDMLRDGIAAQYESAAGAASTKPSDRRRATFAAALACSSEWRDRLARS
ncbi:MAG: polymerase sigma factor FliA [Actinomycetota bacterium]|jgi:RNA polymerase sigma factor for flagellar operon FliA|nr:polymerase sigma factor FliA [Actinomycetota bacterium]